jgi:hypothetical protein
MIGLLIIHNAHFRLLGLLNQQRYMGSTYSMDREMRIQHKIFV